MHTIVLKTDTLTITLYVRQGLNLVNLMGNLSLKFLFIKCLPPKVLAELIVVPPPIALVRCRNAN